MRALMRALHRPVYESRLRALASRIAPHLRAGDSVLDVGCGSGQLAGAILADRRCPGGVTIRGLERRVREGAPIEVTAYGGGQFPFEDGTFDAVILADVLHHDERPEDLLAQSVRVSRRIVIIKDHQLKGPLARPRVAFIDWAANIGYGVPCLYRYNTPTDWERTVERQRLRVVEQCERLPDLYPPGLNLLFGGRLHYFGVLEKAP